MYLKKKKKIKNKISKHKKMQYDQDSIFVCTNPQCKNSKIFT